MKKDCVLLFATVLAVLLSGPLQSVLGQNQQSKRKTQPPSSYYLPKAGFPVLTRSGDTGSTGGSALPSVNGLHLDDGQDRRPGEGVQPYDPGEPELKGACMRWDQRRFPLHIWLSEGKALPQVPFSMTRDDRLRRVQVMLKNPRSFDELPECEGWKAPMNDAVATGFEAWRDMEKEGVVRYVFVERPVDADIMVFFTPSFPGAAGPGGTDVKALTMATGLTHQQVQQLVASGRSRGVPVVMEFKVNEDLMRLQGDAAHEFGHALGIKAHSPYRQDLMFENRAVDFPSPADKATLRALYRMNPAYWYY